MEIIGDDKRLKALYSETRFVDEQTAPSFAATWHRAQARATQPRRALNLAFASALALVIFAVATFAIWSKYSRRTVTYSAFASAAGHLSPRPKPGHAETVRPSLQVRYTATQNKSRTNKWAALQRQSLMAQNRQTEQAAKEIASWQSPTASLLSSSNDDLFKSLPRLNQNSKELKSFLPNRSNDKEN